MIEEISHISNIVVGILGIAIAIYTLVINRNSIFSNSLRNKQLEEIERIRKQLFSLSINVMHAKRVSETCKDLKVSLEELEKDDERDWQHYQNYKENSMYLFYTLALDSYYLLPDWVSKEEVKKAHTEIHGFQPFTLSSLENKKMEEVNEYSSKLLSFVRYLDNQIKSKV